jgi:hypothetical protein
VLEGIVGDALALRLAYRPGQRVHYSRDIIIPEGLKTWKDQRPNFGFSAECGSGAPTSLLGHFLGGLTVRVVRRARSGTVPLGNYARNKMRRRTSVCCEAVASMSLRVCRSG